MSRSRSALASFVLLVALVGSGSQCALLGEHFSLMKETNSFKKATETRVFKHPVKADAKTAELKAEVTLSSGAATFRLRDAEGKVRWEKQLGIGTFSEAQHFGANAGTWQVELDLKGASGRYSFRLKDT